MIRRKDLVAMSLMFFFWTLFDGIVSYSTPLFITQRGFDRTFLGLILASSSVGGAVFDFLLVHFFKNTNFRRFFLLMFLASFIFPFVLFSAKILPLYFLAMVVWGIYYDLGNFGEYNFIGKRIPITKHADGFGLVSIFSSLGYLIAPIIAGVIISSIVSFNVFLFAFIFLFISLIFYFVLLKITRKKEMVQKFNRRNSLFEEFKLWPHVARELWTVLTLIVLINIFDAFFWTIGPILSQKLKEVNFLGGLLLTIYVLPSLFIGFLVGKFTRLFGKKKTAEISFLLGSLILISLYLFNSTFLILFIVFASSFAASLAWPSIKAAFADYIYESPAVENYIEGLVDFAGNVGYIIGPIIAGIVADRFGDKNSLVILGLFSFFITLILIKNTPIKIKVDGHV